MNDAMKDTIPTAYGTVDRTVLEKLRDTYDTNAVLRIVDSLEPGQVRFGDPDGVRADLLRLHAIAHTVINGAPLTVLRDETDIWEMADELITELKDFMEVLNIAIAQLQPLADLVPES